MCAFVEFHSVKFFFPLIDLNPLLSWSLFPQCPPSLSETQLTQPSRDDLSADMGSKDRTSSQPLCLGPLSFPPETLPGSTMSSPAQVGPLPVMDGRL